MVFSSLIFLFFYLPVVLLGYFLIPTKFRNTYLLIVSLIFYFWGEGANILILIFLIVINYLCAFSIHVTSKSKLNLWSQNTSRFLKLLFLSTALITSLGLLFYFKYANFFIQDIYSNLFSQSLNSNWKTIALPLGISFFSFQAMSYTIDVYRGVIPATRNIIDFSCYVSSFPQLVAGPIVRYKDIMHQLKERTVTLSLFYTGIERFIIGLSKKVLIANTVGIAADKVFSMDLSQLNASHVWLGISAYTLQIYYDFSGYSDMAIGLGLMFGFKFPENFNYPYISQSIREFWQRWHISLSTWFRDYLYIPLGGNRKSQTRIYFNLWIVFILCGLWHGANWIFLIWGIYHGFFLVIERIWIGNRITYLPGPLRHFYTLLVVMIGWLIFRSSNLNQAATMLLIGFGLKTPEVIDYGMEYYLQKDVLLVLIFGVIFSIPINQKVMLFFTAAISKYFIPLKNIFLILIFMICIFRLSNNTFNPFLYFRF